MLVLVVRSTSSTSSTSVLRVLVVLVVLRVLVVLVASQACRSRKCLRMHDSMIMTCQMASHKMSSMFQYSVDMTCVMSMLQVKMHCPCYKLTIIGFFHVCEDICCQCYKLDPLVCNASTCSTRSISSTSSTSSIKSTSSSSSTCARLLLI